MPWRQLAPQRPGVTYDSVAFSYGAHGPLETVTDPLGHVSSFFYDTRGQLLTAGLPQTVWDEFFYDDDGNLKRHTSIRTATRYRDATMANDGQGRQLSLLNTLGARETATSRYSGLGHLTKDRTASLLDGVRSLDAFSAAGWRRDWLRCHSGRRCRGFNWFATESLAASFPSSAS
jgi:YD repeat-containing protein